MSLSSVQALVFVSFTLLLFFCAIGTSILVRRFSNALSNSTESNMQRLFLFADTKRLHIGYLFSLIFVPLLLSIFDVHVFIIAGFILVLLLAPSRIFVVLKNRRRLAINASLPTALSQIAGAMEAGSTFISAVELQAKDYSGPLSQEFSLMLREHRMGAHLEVALENLAERVQSEDMDLVVSAALIAADIGGNLSDVFRKLSETLRQKFEMEGKIDSLTAQGRLQGNVVSALPFLIVLPLLVFESAATLPLFTSLLGWVFLTVIVLMILVGNSMIKRIVSIDI